MVQKLRKLLGRADIRVLLILSVALPAVGILLAVGQSISPHESQLEDYTNHLWLSVQPPAPGSTSATVVAHLPQGFTNRLELFTCTNLGDSQWTLVATNLSAAGADSIAWTDTDWTGNGIRYYRAGNADMDSDGDGLSDAEEKFIYHTDPNNADTDGDGMPDGWEVRYGLNSSNGVTTDGLMAWYKLDETAGTNLTDSSGNGHDATLINGNAATASVWGCIGRALFSCYSAYVCLAPGDSSPFLHEAFTTRTVSLWIAPEYVSWARVYDEGNNTNGVTIWIEDNAIYCGVAGGGERAILSAPLTNETPWINATWYHVCAVFSNGTFALYLDGVLQGMTNASFSSVDVHTDAVWLAAEDGMTVIPEETYPWSTVSAVFAGSLDDVRIYDKALSAGIVQELYEIGADPDGDGVGNLDEYLHGTSPTSADTDGDGQSDGQEIHNGSDPLDPASFLASISGTIDYLGPYNPAAPMHLYVVASTSADSSPCYGTAIGDPGWFTVTNLPTLHTYWIKGFKDDNLNGICDARELQNSYASNPVYLSGDTDNVDITLEPDSDSDGMPDWWEIEHGLNPSNAMDAAFDPDQDGVPNLYEYIYNTDPHDGTGTNVPPATIIVTNGMTIQAAIDAAGQYGIVRLPDGVYSGPSNADFTIPNDRHVLISSLNGPSKTIIAQEDDDQITSYYGYPVLDGLTIEGKLSGDSGVSITGDSWNSAWMINCVFASNTITSGSGEIYVSGGNVVFDRCRFLSNRGGVIDANGANLFFANCALTRNACAASPTFFHDSQFAPAVFLDSQVAMLNCTVASNESTLDWGSAIYLWNSFLSLTNCVIWGNQSLAIGCWTNSAATASFCVLQDDVDFPGEGNLWTDPRLGVDGCHLLSNSPCIDAGTDVDAMLDIDGEPRPVAGDPIDIGADEYRDSDHDGLPDWWEMQYFGTLSRDGTGDYDGDGLTDQQEYDLGTNPSNPDTDGDGLSDGAEVNTYLTNPSNPDSDGDGLPDGWEVKYGLNPLSAVGADGAGGDPDGDGLVNADEYLAGMNPMNADTDGNSVPDGQEDAAPRTVSFCFQSGPNGSTYFVSQKVAEQGTVYGHLFNMQPTTQQGAEQGVVATNEPYATDAVHYSSGTDTYATLWRGGPHTLSIYLDTYVGGGHEFDCWTYTGSLKFYRGYMSSAHVVAFDGFSTTTHLCTTTDMTAIAWTNCVDGNGGGGWVRIDVDWWPMAQLGAWADIVPDFNHDRVIDDSDRNQATTSTPFRFWVNDDHDISPTNGEDWPGSSTPDGASNRVNSVRDLVDFFPVYLDLANLLSQVPMNQITVVLRQNDDALKFFYPGPGLTKDQAGNYLTDKETAESCAYQPVTQITSNGITLGEGVLQAIKEEGKGVVLIEAVKETTNPLVLEVRGSDGQVLASKELPLSISGVTNMFRYLNLRPVAGDTQGGGASQTNEPPNNPDFACNGKHVVFIHGFNENTNEGLGNICETFKRLYWSGSRAKYTGVAWYGNAGPSAAYYHTNVIKAFQTASNFADYVGSLSGEVDVIAFSLGNVVVGSAIQDYGANPSNYFMLHAAVTREAYWTNDQYDANMVQVDWRPYTDRLYASKWYQLFPTNDGRHHLTWAGRFASVTGPRLYNFYSSGENVLSNLEDGGVGFQQFLDDILKSRNLYVWCIQELWKGRHDDSWGGSTYGGWGFKGCYDWDTNYCDEMYDPQSKLPIGYSHYSADEAVGILDDSLVVEPFFDRGGAIMASLYADPNDSNGEGSLFAVSNQNRFLAEMIPALSYAAGANPVNALDVYIGGRNINMQGPIDSGGLQNGWPSERMGSWSGNRWLHGDYVHVAYVYVYKLFDRISKDLGGMNQ